METCDLLSYIIIAVIIALVIHLLFKLMKRTTEGMDGSISSGKCNMAKVMPTASQDGPEENLIQEVPDQITGYEPVIEGMSDMSSPEEVPAGSTTGKDCTVCDTSKYVDDYIRESLLHKALVCRDTKKFSNDDVNNHRENVLSFRNNVWQSTNGVDTVDKINDLYLSGNSDISRNHRDVKISDLFDDVTKGTSLYTQNCNRLPKSDFMSFDQGNTVVAGHGGKFLPAYHWDYDEEKTMHGGEHMKGVWPHDGANEDFASAE